MDDKRLILAQYMYVKVKRRQGKLMNLKYLHFQPSRKINNLQKKKDHLAKKNCSVFFPTFLTLLELHNSLLPLNKILSPAQKCLVKLLILLVYFFVERFKVN